MLKKLQILTLGFIFAGTLLNAADLPQRGTCVPTASGNITSPSIFWTGEEIIIKIFGAEHNSQIIGMRAHGDGFKFSTFFEDDLLGLTEILVFSIGSGSEQSYRMGGVTYDTTETGERVLKTIFSLEDADCTLFG